MSTTPASATVVAEFPKTTMLENLAVRADGSVLVVASPNRQIWYVPGATDGASSEPILLHTLPEGQLAQSLIETEPDVYYVYTYGVAVMLRLDLRGWSPGQPITPPTTVLRFEAPAGPNGSALIGPGVMLVADCVEGLIWRVDLAADGLSATSRVWYQHDSMAAGGGRPPVRFADGSEVPFPGINGLAYGPKTQHVYWTTSSQDVFMRVGIDPQTLEPVGDAEYLGKVVNCDDLCLDEDSGVAYITRHPDHIIQRMPLAPDSSAPGPANVLGDPFTYDFIGPTSIDWGRGQDDYGRVAYIPTDGGVIKLAPDGELRPARLVRMEISRETS